MHCTGVLQQQAGDAEQPVLQQILKEVKETKEATQKNAEATQTNAEATQKNTEAIQKIWEYAVRTYNCTARVHNARAGPPPMDSLLPLHCERPGATLGRPPQEGFPATLGECWQVGGRRRMVAAGCHLLASHQLEPAAHVFARCTGFPAYTIELVVAAHSCQAR